MGGHNIKVKVWYEVKTQTDQYLSLVIKGAENWNSAGAEERYYSFDLEKGKQITLEDVLGEDYSRYARRADPEPDGREKIRGWSCIF